LLTYLAPTRHRYAVVVGSFAVASSPVRAELEAYLALAARVAPLTRPIFVGGLCVDIIETQVEP
jgi:hypothetical protein